MGKLFDLNIEQVLEHWEVEHAVREIIANALDEQSLTESKDIRIYKTDEEWHIRDYGRGIKYTHFSQNENTEKLKATNLIGKFGVGLKDALAVFYRKNISVKINSRYAHITLDMADKVGFNLRTLNAVFDDSIDDNMVGTDFVIQGIDDDAIEKAKQMFLRFLSSELLERTRYGEVYKGTGSSQSIFINGVHIAEEDNFLFTYNITNINARIKKALNRERTNVGRTAYTDTIKKILKQCKSEVILTALVEDLQNIMYGTNKDESTWIDITSHASKTLNSTGNVVFMTPKQRSEIDNQSVEILKNSGKKLVMVADSVFDKIRDSVTTFSDVHEEYTESFRYSYVRYGELNTEEKRIFDTSKRIAEFLKRHGYKSNVDIKVSDTIKPSLFGDDTEGVWDSSENAIILNRRILKSQARFVGTLLHEFAHFSSGYSDNTRDFESVLTDMLGHAMNENIVGDQKMMSRQHEDGESSGLLSRLFKRNQ